MKVKTGRVILEQNDNQQASAAPSTGASNTQQTQQQGAQTVTLSSTTTSTPAPTSKGSIMGADFYNDNYSMSANEAANTANSSSIFTDYSIGKIGTDSKTINGLNCVAEGGRYKVQMDSDDDGAMEEMTAAQAMASTFDSELDLYIEDCLLQVVQKYGHKFYTGDGFLSDEALAELAAKGIRVDKINNRTYTFSLVDEEGNVLEDADGNKGSILFGDWIIPDGYAQGAELNLSSMLDLMGYDCVSKADFLGKENGEELYKQVLAEVEAGLQNGEYASSGKKVTDIYGEVKSSWSKSFGSSSSSTNSGLMSNVDWLTENSDGLLIDGTRFDSETVKNIKENYDKLLAAKLGDDANNADKDEIEEETAQQIAKNFGIDLKQVLEIVK